MATRTISLADWQNGATVRFGNPKDWRFKCPMCGTEATPADFVEAHAPNPYSAAGQECIGRYRTDAMTDKPRGCDYAAYGLIPLPELTEVTMPGGRVIRAFPFAAINEV